MDSFIEYFIAFLLVIIIVLGLNGCGSIEVNHNATHVRIFNQLPDNALCEFRGEVIGTQGNLFSGLFTWNYALIAGARNDMINQTILIGGNVIILSLFNSAVTPYSMGTTAVVVIGNAFLCVYD